MPENVDVLHYYQNSRLWPSTFHTDVARLFLVSEINRLGLKEGQEFPLSETALAKALKRSRSTIGEAWDQLANRQLIAKNRGKKPTILNQDKLRPKEGALEAYFEVRKIAETQLACQAARTAKPDQTQSIQNTFNVLIEGAKNLQQFNNGNAEESNRRELEHELFLRDLAFHASIRSISQEIWLELICEVAEAECQFIRYASFENLQGEILEEFISVHQAIMDAINSKDEDAVKIAIKNHFDIADRQAHAVLHE